MRESGSAILPLSRITEQRKRKGLRHKMGCCVTIMALATAAGCKGPHAIAEFAQGLNHAQRRCLRCRPRPGRPRDYDVPGERTFRRLLKQVVPEELKDALGARIISGEMRQCAACEEDGDDDAGGSGDLAEGCGEAADGWGLVVAHWIGRALGPCSVWCEDCIGLVDLSLSRRVITSSAAERMAGLVSEVYC